MSDIVTRLRQDFTTEPIPLHAEAAAEIERLRAALETIATHAPITYVGQNKIDYSCQRIARAALDNQQLTLKPDWPEPDRSYKLGASTESGNAEYPPKDAK